MRGPKTALRPLSIVLSLGVVAALAPSASAAITRKDAYRMGVKGRSASQILRTAFPGVKLDRQSEAPIRVLLADDVPQPVVEGQAITLTNGADPNFAPIALPSGHRFGITRSGAKFTVKDLEADGQWVLSGPAVLTSTGSAGIRLAEPATKNTRFRGALRMQAGRNNSVQVVNVLDVEEYLLGTLPGDMPAAWGARAPSTLAAGAVALRSRALTQRKLPTAPFDFTASDPKYLGLDGERTRTTKAVRRTKNLTLRKGTLPYPASFSGTPAMGSSAFQPRPGTPAPVAFGPTKPVEIDSTKPPPVAGSRSIAAMNMALGFRGVPYRWGGTSPSGFDCSGLLYYVFAAQGIKLPRVAADQARVGAPVRTRAELLPGDVIFFADSSGYIGHIGIYMGNGQMVHAPQTGDVVKISSILTPYYTARFAGGRRYG